MRTQVGSRRPRPLKANDPDWPVVDLELSDDEWYIVIAIARTKKMTVAEYLRQSIRIGMEYERANA